jgi:homeobox-leucine zipper protein
VITNQDGRKSMLKLAERMVISFCAGVSASTTHTWTTLSGTGADDVRVMTRKSIDDPGRPPGIVLSAATSFWLPVSPKRVLIFCVMRTLEARCVYSEIYTDAFV